MAQASFEISGDIDYCLDRLKNIIEENGFFTLYDVFYGCIPRIWRDYDEVTWPDLTDIIVHYEADEEYFILSLPNK